MNGESATIIPVNAEEAANLLDNLVWEQRGEHLSRLQQGIIQGALEGLTYQEIRENYAIARSYTVDYLARYVAYHLWILLTEVLRNAKIIGLDERVRRANLWDSAMRVAQQSLQSESLQKNPPPVPPDPMLEKKLRMRYRITEHLVSTEFSDTYLAEDEDVPDRPMVQISDNLKKVLDKMVRYHFNDRYQSAAEVLQDLRSLTVWHLPPPKRQRLSGPSVKWLQLGLAGVIAGGAIAIYYSIFSSKTGLVLGDGLSAGDKILVTSSSPRLKQRGVEQ